jgi:spore maturation protein CgeB
VRIVVFSHSIRSDWNNGNAHFLRGVVTELQSRGHIVHVYEPWDGWSVQNLAADAGPAMVDAYKQVYPGISAVEYDLDTLDLHRALDGIDLVIVHEWNPAELVARIGAHRRTHQYRLLFHDTHHRSVTDPASMAAYDLQDYDGVLAYGGSIRERYLAAGWAKRVWVWHEAADVRVFRPIAGDVQEDSIVWIGNWGDNERTQELWEFLLAPVQALHLNAAVYGVRYPPEARGALRLAGCNYEGWLPNFEVPQVFARFALTLHVPRRVYAHDLPGVPTIRPFEALACGIPLVSAPWQDTEGLFTIGKDFLMARNRKEMIASIRDVLNDKEMASELSAQGRQTILSRHTCAHRVSELIGIYRELEGSRSQPPVEPTKEMIS